MLLMCKFFRRNWRRYCFNEVEFKARDLKVDLDRELNVIWQELQKIITKEESAADFN